MRGGLHDSRARSVAVGTLVALCAACSSSSERFDRLGRRRWRRRRRRKFESPELERLRQIFPGDNPMNEDVSGLPLNAQSDMYIQAMNPTQKLHPDWGNWSTDHYGIPLASRHRRRARRVLVEHELGQQRKRSSGVLRKRRQLLLSDSHRREDRRRLGRGFHRRRSPPPLYRRVGRALGLHALPDLQHAELLGLAVGGRQWRRVSSRLECAPARSMRPAPTPRASRSSRGSCAAARGQRRERFATRFASRYRKSQNGFIHPATHAAGDADTSLPADRIAPSIESLSFDASSLPPARRS